MTKTPKNFFDLSDEEKTKMIKKAAAESNKKQRELVESTNKDLSDEAAA